jgi:hypothetical protein
MRHKLLLLLSAALLLVLPMAPAQAITNGQPDAEAHPYVGQLLFYVPDAQDPRFSDPGAWFNCTGTLLNESIVVTAGHCTYAVGLDGTSTTADGGNGSGGNDVWINFEEVPDYDMLPPSSGFAPDGNQARYKAWSAALDASTEWHRASSFPHPLYDDAAFFEHDMGVLRLQTAVPMDEYGQLPTLGLIDQLARDHRATYTAVGYGLEKSTPHASFGGDTRMTANVSLVSTRGVYGTGEGTAVTWSSNQGKPHTGGTCFGDSGGPTFPKVEGLERVVLTVTSFGIDGNCAAGGGGYRLDQTDDLEFLATFGVTP